MDISEAGDRAMAEGCRRLCCGQSNEEVEVVDGDCPCGRWRGRGAGAA
jgi:hypothetical protein